MIILNEIQRKIYSEQLTKLKNDAELCLEKLELEKDDEFVLEFVLMAMVGGATVKRIQDELKFILASTIEKI